MNTNLKNLRELSDQITKLNNLIDKKDYLGGELTIDVFIGSK